MRKNQKNGEMPVYVDAKSLDDRLGVDGTALMEKKYLPRDDGGQVTQKSHERFYAVASSVAGIERKYSGKMSKKAVDARVARLTKEFYEFMTQLDFLPGGRVLANAGTEVTALPNCYVLPVPDDLGEIYGVVRDAALIHKSGGGTGYNFSQLRPRGSRVKKGVASGPVSFAGQFDEETKIINSGNRRGANMGILNVDHPDIFEFIGAKMMEGRLSNFNISIGITDEFMRAYQSGGEYCFRFNGKPYTKEDFEKIKANLETEKAGSDVGQKPVPASITIEDNKVFRVYPELDASGRIVYTQEGFTRVPSTKREEIGRVDNEGFVRVSARKTLEIIAGYAYSNGEPGLIFLDNIEKDNQLKVAGRLDTTNPCGEQPLHPYDACNLGSVNLGNMVCEKNGKCEIDYAKLQRTVRTATKFLDNVNDLNKGPIKQIEETILRHRRMGLGVMGWADMLMQLGVGYDNEKARAVAEDVMGRVTAYAKDESVKLARERGVFPDFEISDYDKNNPNERVRNLARTTIAPTGSISMLAGVNSGIEPYFGILYTKCMRGGDRVKMLNPHFVKALESAGFDDEKIKGIVQKVEDNHGSCQGIEDVPENIRRVFKVSRDITPEDHIRMQAAFQKRTDNAISKTINMPNSATVEDVLKAYVLAHQLGCKGMTVYRDGSRDVQVLETRVNKIENATRIFFKPTAMANHNIRANVGFETGYYKIRREDDRLHVIVTSQLYRKKVDSKFHFVIPHAIFQVTKPIGTELAGEFSQSGIDRTQILQSPNPDYVTLVKDLKSVRGDRSFGMGPDRIDSPSHAVGMCLEHFLVSHGILDYDEQGNLRQLVKKSELEEVPTHAEANETVRGWYEDGKVENGGKMNVLGNRENGIRFKCPTCGETKYHIEQNCVDPVCNSCGWKSGKCA